MDTLQLVLTILFTVVILVSISCRVYAHYHPEVKERWYGEED